MSTLRALLIATLLTASAATLAQRPEAAGLSGYVLTPDGVPVSGGSVVLVAARTHAVAPIGSDGRFRIEAGATGPHELHVSVPDLAPHRVGVTVPQSRTLQLPVIRLSAPTYFRVRLVTAAGEPIGSQWLRRQSFDAMGLPFSGPLEHLYADAVDADGTISIGPLPGGITVMSVDAPGLAKTRLRDLHVDGETAVLEGGTVVVDRGGIVQVVVVDGTGAPVPAHQVVLEDVRPLAPIAIPSARTDAQGRATFDRLAAGQYRLRTATVERCGNQPLWIAPLVAISGSGSIERRLVVDGTARLRLTSPHGGLPSVVVAMAPEGGSRPVPPGLLALRDAAMLFRSEPSCHRTTDGEGRAVFSHFPPGPASVRVSLPNSTYIRRVMVPEDEREIVLQVPEGLLSVRVTSAMTNRPLPRAVISLTAGGARIDTLTTATGDALLEGVTGAAGTLAISADGHEPAEVPIAEIPATAVEVALERTPLSSLDARVVTTAGEPIPDAVVELVPPSAGEIGHIAVTDQSGLVTFAKASRSPLLTVSASGFATRTFRIPDRERTGLRLPLERGFRVVLTVDLPASSGRQAIRVFDDRGVPIDHLLDIASDRSLDPPGTVTLGPLMPGAYTVEVQGTRRQRMTIRIVDRDEALRFGGSPVRWFGR
jgi:hypothetical protein